MWSEIRNNFLSSYSSSKSPFCTPLLIYSIDLAISSWAVYAKHTFMYPLKNLLKKINFFHSYCSKSLVIHSISAINFCNFIGKSFKFPKNRNRMRFSSNLALKTNKIKKLSKKYRFCFFEIFI